MPTRSCSFPTRWRKRSQRTEPGAGSARLRRGGIFAARLDVNEIHDAIHRAHQGERPLYGDRLEALARRIDDRRKLVEDIHRRFMKLTPRERELLGLLGSGTAMEHLPKTMGITLATARRHVHNILHKVGARTAIEAIAMARDQGLIPGQELKVGEN